MYRFLRPSVVPTGGHFFCTLRLIKILIWLNNFSERRISTMKKAIELERIGNGKENAKTGRKNHMRTFRSLRAIMRSAPGLPESNSPSAYSGRKPANDGISKSLFVHTLRCVDVNNNVVAIGY